MNQTVIPIMALATCLSCSQPFIQETGTRPVKLTEALSLNTIEKSFSGIVVPDQFSDLAFKMSGPLISMNVEEGQKVQAGQVVAEIDPQDFKWDYEAKKSSYQTAEAQLQRAERLLAKQAISVQEYETIQASYSNAKAAFEYAQSQLEQTKLRAPFNGFIQKKYVENYQKVQAGQGIVNLINPLKLQVQFTMPESNIPYFTFPYTFYVTFDNYKEIRFKAKIKEYVEASPDGSGVPVFLTIDDPRFDLKKYKITVGFSCQVTLLVDHANYPKGAVYIPLSAVVASEVSDTCYVYVYQAGDQTVERRPIRIGELIGKEDVVVVESLQAGERVVSAGATRLTNGQLVKVLTD